MEAPDQALPLRYLVQKWLEAGRPSSIKAFAREHKVTPKAVGYHIKRLRPKPPKEETPLELTEELLERLRGGAISDADANRVLGRIIADGKDVDRIKAIDVYDERNRASTARIGPPPPQSPEQKLARLSLIFQAADTQTLIEAARSCGYTLTKVEPHAPALETPVHPEGPIAQDQASGLST